MIFDCFLCGKDFESATDTIDHLKRYHDLVDNSVPIKCVIKTCNKTYLSFRALKAHLSKCEKVNATWFGKYVTVELTIFIQKIVIIGNRKHSANFNSNDNSN